MVLDGQPPLICMTLWSVRSVGDPGGAVSRSRGAAWGVNALHWMRRGCATSQGRLHVLNLLLPVVVPRS